MQPSAFLRCRLTGPPRGARSKVDTGRKAVEDGRQLLNRLCVSADHQRVAAFEAPHAPTHTDVDVVQLLGGERFGSVDIVPIERVATVDHRVARGEQRRQLLHGRVDERSGHHDPHVPRGGEVVDEVGERRRTGDTLAVQLADRIGVDVVADALVPRLVQASDHVGSHAPESDHSQLHDLTVARHRERRVSRSGSAG